MIEDLIKSNRSCRRFLQKEAVPVDTLRWLVNLARLSASAANLQPLKYILSNEPHKNEIIFSTARGSSKNLSKKVDISADGLTVPEKNGTPNSPSLAAGSSTISTEFSFLTLIRGGRSLPFLSLESVPSFSLRYSSSQ